MFQAVFKRQSALMKALANPKRLEVLHLLKQGKLSVSEIERMLGLRQANLSQHLMVLRRVGVVLTERKGKEIYYELAHSNFAQASELVRQVLMRQFGGEIAKASRQLSVVKDPVCGMKLTRVAAARSLKRGGRQYYFCGAGCEQAFKKR